MLTLSTIVDAASSVEPAQFSMAAVAQKLGVSVGTLYTYVDGRDELERQVSVRRMRRNRLADTGQSWQEVIQGLVLGAVNSFVADPKSLVRYMEGVVGAVDGLEGMEDVLAMLVKRGFSVRQATEAHRNASLLALGLGLASIHRRRAAERGRTHEAMIPRRLQELGRKALPTVSLAAEDLIDEEAYFAPNGPVAQLIAGIEAQLSGGGSAAPGRP